VLKLAQVFWLDLDKHQIVNFADNPTEIDVMTQLAKFGEVSIIDGC
jgi:hypothetical protein